MSTPKFPNWDWQPEGPRWQLFVSWLWADVCQRGDEWHWQVQINIEDESSWTLGSGVTSDDTTGKAEVLRVAAAWFADGLSKVKVLQEDIRSAVEARQAMRVQEKLETLVEKSQVEPEICGYLYDVGRICRREPKHDGAHADVRHSDLPREEAVKRAMDTHECPYCGAEMDCTSEHERDSSNDVHFCPKCRWSYGEMETWGKR